MMEIALGISPANDFLIFDAASPYQQLVYQSPIVRADARSSGVVAGFGQLE